MKNLHLKNLNIDHTKTKIEYILKNIQTKNPVINEFKEYYINDLYNEDYDTKHLIGIAEEMIYIMKSIKNFTIGKKILNDEIKKLEQDHLLLITKYQYLNEFEYLIQYNTDPEGEFDTDYKEISITIHNNNMIQEIEFTNI